MLAFDDMMAWLQEDNWAAIEDELYGRGVSTSECYTEWLTVCDALIYDMLMSIACLLNPFLLSTTYQFILTMKSLGSDLVADLQE